MGNDTYRECQRIMDSFISNFPYSVVGRGHFLKKGINFSLFFPKPRSQPDFLIFSLYPFPCKTAYDKKRDYTFQKNWFYKC